jgi:hypothetical protein
VPCSAAASNATANASARSSRTWLAKSPGLARATSADITMIAASFFGLIVSSAIVPDVAGFLAPSATHEAVGFVAVYGMA